MDKLGYIHITLKRAQKKSLTMLLDCIKLSKLYINTKVICLGILNDNVKIINDEI